MGNCRRYINSSFNGNILTVVFSHENCIFIRRKNFEKRIAITPDIVKKYTSIGFKVSLPKNYGSHLGFNDDEFKSLGVEILENEKDLIQSCDIAVQLALPSDEKLSFLEKIKH